MIRKGSKVALVKLPERHIERIRVGMLGQVIAVRPSDNQYLVKWRGKACPVSHDVSEIKLILHSAVIRKGVLDCQVCVPSGWSDDLVIEFANREYPCGTSAGWVIRREGSELLNGDPERKQCAENVNNVHIMLDA